MSFETVVRPFVAPAIRLSGKPPAALLQDTPEQGVAVLRGQGGSLIDLRFSEQSSWSRSRVTEVSRTEDIKRVYQKEKDGTINKENFVDIAEVTKMTTADGQGVQTEIIYLKRPPADNVEIVTESEVTDNPAWNDPWTDESGGAAP